MENKNGLAQIDNRGNNKLFMDVRNQIFYKHRSQSNLGGRDVKSNIATAGSVAATTGMQALKKNYSSTPKIGGLLND